MRAALAAAALVVLGAAGLVRGLVPEHTGTAPPPPGQLTAGGAYVVAPAPSSTVALAYFTITNATNHADRLLAVQTGAGSTAVLHTDVKGVTSAAHGAVTVPAHGRLALSPGKSELMIGGLFDTLTAGQDVSMTLSFEDAGTVGVTAPVVRAGTR